MVAAQVAGAKIRCDIATANRHITMACSGAAAAMNERLQWTLFSHLFQSLGTFLKPAFKQGPAPVKTITLKDFLAVGGTGGLAGLSAIGAGKSFIG